MISTTLRGTFYFFPIFLSLLFFKRSVTLCSRAHPTAINNRDYPGLLVTLFYTSKKLRQIITLTIDV